MRPSSIPTRDSEGLIAIPVGALADPAFPPPQVSVWEERKHDWLVVPDQHRPR